MTVKKRWKLLLFNRLDKLFERDGTAFLFFYIQVLQNWLGFDNTNKNQPSYNELRLSRPSCKIICRIDIMEAILMSINENQIPCPGGTIYTIRPGDSYYSLAKRFNTTVNALQAANPNVNPTNLQIGQEICIPVPPVPGPCPGGFIYTVLAGETIYGLARRYGISVDAILAANPGLDPNSLQVARRICIPAPPRTEPCPGRLFTIEPGDTFIGIAGRFGYTLDALLAINPGIDPDRLQVGQQICLPPAPGGGPFPCYGGTIYQIQPGDTLYSVARRYGLTLQQLLAANPDITNPNYIQIGQPVCIPR